MTTRTAAQIADLRPKQRHDAELAHEKNTLLSERQSMASALAAGDVDSAPAFVKRNRAIDDRISEIDAIRTALQADDNIPAEEKAALKAEFAAQHAAREENEANVVEPARKRLVAAAAAHEEAAKDFERTKREHDERFGLFTLNAKINAHRDRYPHLYAEAQS